MFAVCDERQKGLVSRESVQERGRDVICRLTQCLFLAPERPVKRPLALRSPLSALRCPKPLSMFLSFLSAIVRGPAKTDRHRAERCDGARCTLSTTETSYQSTFSLHSTGIGVTPRCL